MNMTVAVLGAGGVHRVRLIGSRGHCQKLIRQSTKGIRNQPVIHPASPPLGRHEASLDELLHVVTDGRLGQAKEGLEIAAAHAVITAAAALDRAG